MKKFITLLLTFTLLLSLTSCGLWDKGSTLSPDSGETTVNPENDPDASKDQEDVTKEDTKEETEAETSKDEETEPAIKEVKWDKDQEFRCKYTDVVLMEDENIRISADYATSEVRNKDNSEDQGDEGIGISLVLNAENLTNKPILIVDLDGASNVNIPAGKSSQVRLEGTDDWNLLVGDTENCYRETYHWTFMQVMDELNRKQIIGGIGFDWYVSEETPFVNVVTDLDEVVEADRVKKLEEYKERTSLYHTENEMISVDVVKAKDAYSAYEITYLATNQSDSVLYVLPQNVYTREKSDYDIYSDFWKYAKTIEPGESWFRTERYAENRFKDGPAEMTVTAYNAIRQKAAEISIALKAPETFPEEPTDQAEFTYEDSNNTADKEAASAFTDITALEPFFTVENEALRMDLLKTYTEFEANKESYVGMAIYALTNLTEQDLYYYSGGMDHTIASKETIYGAVETGDSYVGGSGGAFRGLELMASKDSNMAAASVGFQCYWTYNHETKEIGVTNFAEYRNNVDADILSGNAVYYTYSGAVITKNDFYRLEVRSINGVKNEEGVWNGLADIVLVNTYGLRYLPFDPGKQGEGYDPGRDWIDPEEAVFHSVEFSCSDEDRAAEVTMNLNGYSWDGTVATPLFEDTVTFTLRLDKENPVGNGN